MSVNSTVSDWNSGKIESQVVDNRTNPDGEAKREVIEKSLWRWNIAMAILHLVQAIIVLAGSQTAANAKNFRVQMITAIPTWTRGFPAASIQSRGSIPFAGVTSGFAFLSSAAHFLVLACFPRYLSDLRKGMNIFRWYEYALSSSLMIVLIAMLFGVWDAMNLALIGSINACMCLFGLLHERMNAGKPSRDVNWEPFWFGCFAGLVPWAIIFAYIGSSPSVAQIPGFVWGILGAYLFFFNTFPMCVFDYYLRPGGSCFEWQLPLAYIPHHFFLLLIQ